MTTRRIILYTSLALMFAAGIFLGLAFCSKFTEAKYMVDFLFTLVFSIICSFFVIPRRT